MIAMKRIEKKYKGVIVPMITPVDEHYMIDPEAVSRIIGSFVSAGVDPFILGTTGESFSVSDSQKLELVKVTGWQGEAVCGYIW